MKQIKHVLVLLLLILPMFALAPTLVASPNNTPMSYEKVDTSLPAQFAKETLRVAVYAESNLTLPAYSTGGAYTDYYQNVIDLLESAGYAVTAVSTQDILDHKLMVADYDTFVLPNQLPRESVINYIKDFWLGGGGVLSFGASFGFLCFSGLIDPSLEGEFSLYPIDGTGVWTYAGLTGDELYDGIYVNQRNPVTKSLEEDTVYPYAGNQTLLGGFHLAPLLGERYLELANQDGQPTYTSIAGFDNPNGGGRIVFLTGNCSSFETWIEPVIVDAVDWLAPRPKARVAFDFTHHAYYGVDAWDTNVSNVPRYNIWRDFLVNHSFVCDKLYPTGSSLASADLAPFDVLIISRPNLNYSLTEMNLIRSWVEGGKSLFYLTDFYTPEQVSMNELLLPWDISVFDGPNMGGFTTSDFNDHPTLEGISSVAISGGEWLNTSGSAYPIVNQSTDVAIAATEPGLGRVVVSGDINWIDYTHYYNGDNLRFGINIINWLSSSTAKILVYADASANILHPNTNPYDGPVVRSLNDLGVPFYLTAIPFYFNMSLFLQNWDMIVFDNTQSGTTLYQHHLADFVAGGGKLVFSTWNVDPATGTYFGVELRNTLGTPPTVYLWEQNHPIFNLPADYDAATVNTTLDLGFGTDAINYTTYANATPLAGYTAAHAGAAIALGAHGKVIVNGMLLTIYNEDTDNSTYSDNQEIWENEIAFLYYDRPMINHPDDVTYMETETGNEITWTPVADAGPWEYIVRENGSIIDSGHWGGGSITIDVDGVNVSITEYQLTVFDRLGYSASDLVNLNVTEYVATTTGGIPIDPMLLLIIGVGIAAVVIILIVVMQLKKKK